MKKISLYFYDKFLLFLFYCFRIFPIKYNKIVITNFYGKGYGDSAKYILNELNCSKYDIYWVIDKNRHELPENIKTIRFHRIQEVYHLSTAKIWIDNSRKLPYIRKRKGQYYIQTWHGGLALKKIENDAIDKLGKKYVKLMKNDSKMIDIMTSNSDFCTKMFRRAFLYNGEILEVGSPRNDILLSKNNSIKAEILKKYNVENKKICLYAPTYRNDSKRNPYNIDYKSLLKTLNEKTNDEWIIFLKFHPSMINKKQWNIKNNNNLINVSNHDDMQELIYSSDLLITDYSSTMFEAMIANKPVFLFASDINSYIEERGFYFKFEDLPFPLSKNNKELNNNIKNTNFLDFIPKYDEFNKKIGLKESGHASKKIVDIINKLAKD